MNSQLGETFGMYGRLDLPNYTMVKGQPRLPKVCSRHTQGDKAIAKALQGMERLAKFG